jgi:hypothetical protein
MKSWMIVGALSAILAISTSASTIMIVPIFEPISLHGTDGDDAISDVGSTLQAAVLSRPVALTGGMPEVLVDAIRSPHLIPTNSPNYKVQETNLLVLCNIGISGEMIAGTLTVRLNVSELTIPPEVDLTTRQILNLAIIALKKTLEEYQREQTQPLPVEILVEGAEGPKESLRDLATKFTVAGQPTAN